MKVLRFLFVSVLTMILVCYVYHKSILSYITQQYHIVSDTPITQTPLFEPASLIAQSLESLRVALFEGGVAIDSQGDEFAEITEAHQDTLNPSHKQNNEQIQSKLDSNNIPQGVNSLTQSQDSNTSFNNAQAFSGVQHSISNQDSQNNPSFGNNQNSNTTQSPMPLYPTPPVNPTTKDALSNTALPDSNAPQDLETLTQESESNPYAHIPRQPRKDKIAVSPQTRFLFIGDSLMQGIGMTLPRMLQQHGYKSKNIAKQSTGLTFPSFFDWQKATKQAFAQHSDIGVVVVCLGANDPWNMAKVRFGTPAWERIYRQRIQAIFDIAHAHNAQVMWYALPATKNPTLNKKLLYLNELYEDMVLRNGGVFLSAQAVLLNGQFSPSIKDEAGRSKQVRSPDGIHFTTYGSRLLSQTLLDSLILPTQNEDSERENHTQDSQTLEPNTTQNIQHNSSNQAHTPHIEQTSKITTYQEQAPSPTHNPQATQDSHHTTAQHYEQYTREIAQERTQEMWSESHQPITTHNKEQE